MVRYVVFTQEELDAIKAGFDVISNDDNGNSVIYTNEEKYTKMMMSMKEKEIDDRDIPGRMAVLRRCLRIHEYNSKFYKLSKHS